MRGPKRILQSHMTGILQGHWPQKDIQWKNLNFRDIGIQRIGELTWHDVRSLNLTGPSQGAFSLRSRSRVVDHSLSGCGIRCDSDRICPKFRWSNWNFLASRSPRSSLNIWSYGPRADGSKETRQSFDHSSHVSTTFTGYVPVRPVDLEIWIVAQLRALNIPCNSTRGRWRFSEDAQSCDQGQPLGQGKQCKLSPSESVWSWKTWQNNFGEWTKLLISGCVA